MLKRSQRFTIQGISLIGLACVFAAGARAQAGKQGPPLRPPAVPLVACDPYFSIWSPSDRLTETDTVHWTGKPHPIFATLEIDGVTYRLMGSKPAGAPALEQTGLEVLPTRTIYTYQGAGVKVVLTFLTPALPEDLLILARPVTYLICHAASTDGKPHQATFGVAASTLLAVNTPDQEVKSEILMDRDGLRTLRTGSVEQAVLAKRGDDLRIDWGYLYLSARADEVSSSAIGSPGQPSQEQDAPRNPSRPGPAQSSSALTISFQPASVTPEMPAERVALIAYDDLESIQYFGHHLKPYWRKTGWEAQDLLRASFGELADLRKRCEAFDQELMDDLAQAGGAQYARIASLAYRQCFAAGKIAADAHGQPLIFPKENFSNGCIGTVDVIFPMAPQYLLFGPSLTKAILVQNLDYASSPRWKFPFAPHDLGTYPHANGQVYGGGERTEDNQMPVEESGNMLILTAALAKREGNAEFARKYWPTLLRWAEYLKDKGFDPENQLCTDDFAGHLAHNVNLSAKAIIGLGAFAQIADRLGEQKLATQYEDLAQSFARKWVAEARDADHYRLAFDRAGTWSQKYNLVWDRLLGLNLFPPEVARTEMDFYKKVQNRYGLPLDNRADYTKLDWISWTATLTGDRADFETLINPVHAFLNETPDRVPMTDWYDTKTGKMVGFRARSVVGGVFLRLLDSESIWKKWSDRDRTRAAGWAPLPQPPRVVAVIPTSEDEPQAWRYTTEEPPADAWMSPGFDDSAWKSGPGGFGTKGTPGAIVRTEWKSPRIWLRRQVALPAGFDPARLRLRIHHDEDARVYLNGIPCARLAGYSTDYQLAPIAPAASSALQPGPLVIAVSCRQTGGGQYIDLGIVEIEEVNTKP
jgi:hypothetical protein